MRSLALKPHPGPIRAKAPFWFSYPSARALARCNNTYGDRAATAAGPLRTLSNSRRCLNRNTESLVREASTLLPRSTIADSNSSDNSRNPGSHEETARSEPSLEAIGQQIPSLRSSWTFQKYLFESEVAAPASQTPRLVDTPEHADDFALWLDLLRFQKRINGHSGAWMIFKGMRARQKDVPVQGPEAEQFWKAFVLAGQHLGSAEEVWEHAKDLYKRTNQRFDGLYEIFVGSSLAKGVNAWKSLRAQAGTTLRQEPDLWYESAYTWHKLLAEIDLHASGNLKALVPIANRHKRAMEVLQRIECECSEQDPTRQPEELSVPTTNYTADPTRRTALGSMPSVTAPHVGSTLPTAMDYESGERSVTITDEFCARAFATKAFNPSFVIRGLGAFGIDSVGPLAIQSLARRCRDLVETYGAQEADKLDEWLKELAQQLENLKSCGIRILECKYSLLVQRFTLEQDGSGLDAIISSDQHPDSYEDDALQQQLFMSHLRVGDMTRALDALSVLTLTDSNPTGSAWNILLQTQMRLASQGHLTDWHRVSHILQKMLAANIPISEETIQHCITSLLPPRNPGKAQVTIASPVDRLTFVANMWTQILDSSQRKILDPNSWHEIQKRFGLNGRLDELERLILLLAERYSSGPRRDLIGPPPGLDEKSVRALPSLPNLGHSTIDQLFPDRRQKAIIEWYFFSLSRPDSRATPGTKIVSIESSASNVEKWARGVALIQKLKWFGLSVDTRTVRDACRQRLIGLFRETGSLRRRNQSAKMRNRHSLRSMVSYLQDLWQPAGSLFAVPEHMLQKDSDETDRFLQHVVLDQPGAVSRFYNEHDFVRIPGGYVPRRHSVVPGPPPLEDRARGLKMLMSYYYMKPNLTNEAHKRIKGLQSFNGKFGDKGVDRESGRPPPLNHRGKRTRR